jgi:hypothetical protein
LIAQIVLPIRNRIAIPDYRPITARNINIEVRTGVALAVRVELPDAAEGTVYLFHVEGVLVVVPKGDFRCNKRVTVPRAPGDGVGVSEAGGSEGVDNVATVFVGGGEVEAGVDGSHGEDRCEKGQGGFGEEGVHYGEAGLKVFESF